MLVVGVRWPPETFIQRKLEGLAARGLRVTVAASVPWRRAKIKLNGVALRRLYHSDDPPILSIGRFLRDAIALAAQAPTRLPLLFKSIFRQRLPLKTTFARLQPYLSLVRAKPDVVHFEWNSAAISFMPLYDIWNKPVVVSCRGSQINVRPHVNSGEGFAALMGQTFQRAAVVHSVSEATMREAIKHGLDQTKSVVIPPAVDTDVFRASSEKANNKIFTVISVGSLNWVKGYEYALIAVRTLINNGVPLRYDIVGGGPDFQRLLYTIHDLGLTAHVKLHGQLPPNEVVAMLQKADVFLLSSLSEGISNAALEAMACALPIVSTDCGGMREAVTDEKEGLLVPLRDPDSIAVALGKLLIQPELRQRLGAAARARVVASFSLAQQISRFSDLYQSVVSGEAA